MIKIYHAYSFVLVDTPKKIIITADKRIKAEDLLQKDWFLSCKGQTLNEAKFELHILPSITECKGAKTITKGLVRIQLDGSTLKNFKTSNLHYRVCVYCSIRDKEHGTTLSKTESLNNVMNDPSGRISLLLDLIDTTQLKTTIEGGEISETVIIEISVELHEVIPDEINDITCQMSRTTI